MNKARKVTAEDLAKIKGLGETKAQLILSALDEGAPEDLTEIKGVSERLAGEVGKLVEDPDNYTPEPPKPRKKATAKKATAKKANTNGSGDIKAGDIRKFAQQAQALGLSDLAQSLQLQAAPFLDNETVDISV